MRLLHLSDLHFGTEHNDLTVSIKREAEDHKPDMAIISGDFTQIANKEEFEKARDFMRSLPCPVFSIPGNHDIPRFDFRERFFDPFAKYKHYISDDLSPVFENDKMIIAGINSARRILPHWNWANGAVSDQQIEFIKRVLGPDKNKLKILTLHHPLHRAEGVPLDVVVFGGRKAMQVIHDLKIDLVLTGHVHHASIQTIKNTVFLSAATALSSRIRYQENGYNIIDFKDDYFEITHRTYRHPAFETELKTRHQCKT